LAPTSLEHQPQVEGGVPEAKGEGEPGGFHMEGVGAFAEPRGSDGRDEAPSHRSE
jgi:hypothetical protein